MRFLFIILLFTITLTDARSFLIVGKPAKKLHKWTDYSGNENLNLRYLVTQLSKSPTGKNLLLKAKQKASFSNQNLFDVVKIGNASLTDTTLTRKFKMNDPTEIEFESSSVVFVNKYLDEQDAILDLAHELTHFIYREPFNPYVKNFTLGSFIRSTVEGPGGEVNAFLAECRVLKELFGEGEVRKSICSQVFDSKNKVFVKELATKKFYHIGEHFHDFKNLLSQKHLAVHFPEIQNKKAHFISSAYGKPYPVAAFEEYQQVMTKACSNDSKRLRLYREKARRAPASLTRSYHERCSDFN